MTFDDIFKLIPVIEAGLAKGKTRYQIAADAHADSQAQPSALNLKPMKERAPRQIRKAKPETVNSDLETEFTHGNAEPLQSNGHDTEALP
jgi:hypothetical protein